MLNLNTWSFAYTPYENVVANILLQNGIYGQKAVKFKRAFLGVQDGENVGEFKIDTWFHDLYGNEKPLCLWDKLMRELGRIGTQINAEVDRFARDISAEFDRANKRVKAEIEREIEHVKEIGRKIDKEIHRAWDKLTGGCFITTATLYHLGEYDDNCYELTLIRKIRDEWLVNQPRGKEIIEIYYKLAPKIVKAINNDTVVYTVLWNRYIEPFFVCLENNEYKKALNIYITMVCVLKKKYEL